VPQAGKGIGSTLGNVIWLLIAGWWLAILHIVTGVVLCLTIIGIPLGLANFKLITVGLRPFAARSSPSRKLAAAECVQQSFQRRPPDNSRLDRRRMNPSMETRAVSATPGRVIPALWKAALQGLPAQSCDRRRNHSTPAGSAVAPRARHGRVPTDAVETLDE
jgi:hypothetical protein